MHFAGLRDFGYVEGQNLLVEYRGPGKAPSQLDGFAAELIALKVDVIVAGSSQTTRAAFNQTKTIPIVTLSTNPVGLGFVASLATPGGNVTGVSLLGPDVSGKRLLLLKQAIPGATRVAAIWNPDDPAAHFSVEESQTAAAALGLKLQVLDGGNADAIDGALQAAMNAQAEAVVLLPPPLFDGLAQQIAGLAMQRRLPILYFDKEAVKTGILMSYGANPYAAIGDKPTLSIVSAKGQSRPIYRSSIRPNSSWRSIRRPPRPSGWTCRKACWQAPMR